MKTTFERIADAIVELNGIDRADIKPDSLISEDLGLDSLDRLEMVMAMEEEFGIDVLDEEAGKILTVGDAVSCADRLTGERR